MSVSASPGNALRNTIKSSAQPLSGYPHDYDALFDMIDDARFVMLGEATHGTHEFYRERAFITQRLIEEKGFHGVAVEADWPDAYRINRYVRGMAGSDASPSEALSGFRRFPAWMWRNADMVRFVDWLRHHNESLGIAQRQVGFYGLDLYSLFTSIDEVLNYLDHNDQEAARIARERYACFDHFHEDSQLYGYMTRYGLLRDTCEKVVGLQLRELQERIRRFQDDGDPASDEHFYAEQNARLIVNAEQYYRSMFESRISSWNLRDRHMAETLDALAAHLTKANGEPAKLVVWAHNSHIGDARATELGWQGEWTVGQLARQSHGRDAFLLGFTTYCGTVTAASRWDGPAELKHIQPGLPGSYERLFHDTGMPQFLLPLRGSVLESHPEFVQKLERAIGVIYLPQTERQSHYFDASLPMQFDAVIHIDDTRALVPLERVAPRQDGEAPETFPAGV
ncbi:MAG TPA: erythromycin esterase family protein [Paucimonas sp.]|nr:erythromycin esterase family protein [Paucimonas sp.]